jgi:hypothetical protein
VRGSVYDPRQRTPRSFPYAWLGHLGRFSRLRWRIAAADARRLSEARLPPVNGVSRSSRGTGRPCIVCRRAIEPTEVERQVESVGVFLYAHEACYKLRREESVAGRVAKKRTEEP